MKKVTPGRLLGVILVITFVSICVFYLKAGYDGIDRAKERRDRSTTCSFISQAILVFSALNGGAKPKSISDLKIDGNEDLAPFNFYFEGEKIGSRGISIFAEVPTWRGSSKNYVIYFDGSVLEE